MFFFGAFRSSRVGISSQKGRKMIVFEPKRINQWQLSRFVPSGIIYGRMERTIRNYGLRIISRPENKHSLLRRGRKSLPGSSDHGWWACRSSWRSLSWMPKNHPRVRLWNQRQWLLTNLSVISYSGRFYDIYQAGPSQRSSNRLRAKTSKGSPNPRALSLYLACM